MANCRHANNEVLYHPVLPVLMEKSCAFVLCVRCKKEDVRGDCPHTDEEREFHGICDSEMERTAHNELLFLKQEWKHTHKDKLNNDVPEFEPTFTYIVIQKRHLVRFYPQEGHPKQSLQTQVGNVPAGTTVDRVVVNPDMFDFYLASQNGQIGTTRPARYTVVYDEWKLSADQLIEMCYRLCFVYARASQPVSFPAPTYYAHLVCERGKEYFKALDVLGETPELSETHLDHSLLEAKSILEHSMNIDDDLPGMVFV